MLELEKKYYVKPVGSNALTRAVLIFLWQPIKKNISKQSLALIPYYNAYT